MENINLCIVKVFMAACLLPLFMGCGSGGSGTPDAGAGSSPAGTGAVSLSLDWGSAVKTAAKSAFLAPAGVLTVRAVISGPGMASAIQKDFPAVNGSGLIDGIPAGTGRTVAAQGLDASGTVTYQGVVQNITVQAGQTTDLGTVAMIPAPTPAYSYLPAAPVTGQTVTFTDATTGSPTSWWWTFGDGSTSSTQSPSHVFAAAGIYTVTLTAGNATGSKSYSQNVTVRAPGYALSGTIALNGAGLSGVTVNLGGGMTTTTDSSGSFLFSAVQSGSYTLTPVLAGYAFTPVSMAVTVNSAAVTGRNFTATSDGSIAIKW